MLQIIQDLKSGETLLIDAPMPSVSPGNILIRNKKSLVSLGTEKMLVDFGKANYLQKAMQQPEKVKQVLSKVKTDGIKPTLQAVQRKLDEPIPLGYSCSGEVIGIGEGVKDFSIGDRVVSNGSHAEVVNVPKNLVSRIPDSVNYEEASFTVVGSIALQGIRLLNPTFGETIVVTGLGLIGLIAIQILKANGCNVIGLDYDDEKIKLAKSFGVEAFNTSSFDLNNYIEILTNSRGVDGILITASTKSNDVISQSAKICRQRGRIVLIGVIGLNINRADFYKKEITFQVSCSYGPGRYDNNYEKKGLDYPIGFVRWTQKRNFEAFLCALANKSVSVDSLITDRVELKNYSKIYSGLNKKSSIAHIIEYGFKKIDKSQSIIVHTSDFSKSNGVIGIIGSGNFTRSMILPVLKKIGAKIKYISSSGGLSSTILAKKYNIGVATSNLDDLLNDPDVDAIIIATRHNNHANLVIKSLASGKHVFVEKPLALSAKELQLVKNAYEETNKSLTVGFNRRFSPFLERIKKITNNQNHPINVIATINAGYIPKDHWVHDLKIGGGRIIGEACHFIDLISYIAGSDVASVVMNANGVSPNLDTDNASIILKYKNGSNGVINYFSNGSSDYSKERIEIFALKKNIIIENFRKLSFYGFKEKNHKSSQDKGHLNQFKRWNEMIINGNESIISFDSIMNTSKSAIACLKSLKEGKWIDV